MIVYWAVSNVTNMSPVSKALYSQPTKLTNKNVFNQITPNNKQNNFKLCPAFLDHIDNVYGLHFPIDLDLKFTSDDIVSSLEQDLFNYFVNIRDFDQKFFGFKVNMVFFCEEDLEMELMPPYLEDNEFASSVTSVPGKFNIGKWFRPIDYACFLNKGKQSLKVKHNDIFNYVKFNTKKNIEFKQFDYIDQIENIQKDVLRSKMILGTASPRLDYYYKLLQHSRYKKKIIKLIKENILEE
jgi:hypothetical protein